MRDAYTIVIDTREKKPLIFPQHLVTLNDTALPSRRAARTVRLHTARRAIPKGDYLLEGYEGHMIVERKGNLSEVAVNCLNPRRRRLFVAELDHLNRQCRWPLLLLEGTPRALLAATADLPHPGIAVAALQRLLLQRHVLLQLLPTATLASRRAAGEWIAHLLLSAAITPRKLPTALDSPMGFDHNAGDDEDDEASPPLALPRPRRLTA